MIRYQNAFIGKEKGNNQLYFSEAQWEGLVGIMMQEVLTVRLSQGSNIYEERKHGETADMICNVSSLLISLFAHFQVSGGLLCALKAVCREA